MVSVAVVSSRVWSVGIGWGEVGSGWVGLVWLGWVSVRLDLGCVWV